MPNNIAHFAIEADNLARARKFYEQVFGWRFTPWGPPDFLQIVTGDKDDPGLLGALQRRREPLSGTGSRGFVCTIAVDSIDDIAVRIEKHGGRIAMQSFLIEGVGTLLFFLDTESNRVGAMQYLSGALQRRQSELADRRE